MDARFETWPESLMDFLESRRETPFVWGRNDCCLFAADWVLTATGSDPAAPLRGSYESFWGAARIALKAGGMRRLVDAALAPLGRGRESVRQARRGDLVYTTAGVLPGFGAVGVVSGNGAAFVGRDGLLFLPLSFCSTGWRI